MSNSNKEENVMIDRHLDTIRNMTINEIRSVLLSERSVNAVMGFIKFDLIYDVVIF